MSNQEFIEVILPKNLPSLEDLEGQFPPRDLGDGAIVSRVGPSPTGFMHIGTLYTGLLSSRLAAQTDGVSMLRIEDTDQKREVAGATDFIASTFKHYDMHFDEGRNASGDEVGAYGPYTQSQRTTIYNSIIKHMLENSLAYICFATPDELDEMRKEQERTKVPIGYYGKWAKWRDRPADEIVQKLKEGTPYVVRFRSEGDSENRKKVYDKILGERELPDNDHDIVILKQDGLPTYHLAHIVDDHFMRTSLVLRGSEWFNSLPLHLQMWDALGWKPPKYAHIMPIMKMDGESRRKLSKRKDPEANMQYFDEEGYPQAAVIDYLLNIANSQYEPWREKNPTAPSTEYQITFKGLQQSSGPLFDFDKLKDISKNVLAGLSAKEILSQLTDWATEHDAVFAKQLTADPAYSETILNIERGGKRARKDNATFQQVRDDISYFFDNRFELTKDAFEESIHPVTNEQATQLMTDFMQSFEFSDTQDQWFDKLKLIAEKHGFATRTREYKDNPEKYNGSVSDIAKVIRILLTGREHSPDLYSIMQAMGKDRVAARLNRFNSA